MIVQVTIHAAYTIPIYTVFHICCYNADKNVLL